MADSTTSKSDLAAENDRLRSLLTDNGIDPDGNAPNHGVVGNFADLQRLGAIAVADGKTNVDDAIVKPASVDVDSGEVTGAETVSGNPPPELA